MGSGENETENAWTEDRPAGKSRSQKKRDSTALQALGEDLAALSPALWRTLPLSEDLAEALNELAAHKSHEARRRHLQYIGRLMRELDDPEALRAALERLRDGSRADAARQRRLERMREDLLHQDEARRSAAFEEALHQLPGLERNRLRHLIEAALGEREAKRPPRFARELFRYLRSGG